MLGLLRHLAYGATLMFAGYVMQKLGRRMQQSVSNVTRAYETAGPIERGQMVGMRPDGKVEALRRDMQPEMQSIEDALRQAGYEVVEFEEEIPEWELN